MNALIQALVILMPLVRIRLEVITALATVDFMGVERHVLIIMNVLVREGEIIVRLAPQIAPTLQDHLLALVILVILAMEQLALVSFIMFIIMYCDDDLDSFHK
jgi:hypothetical protein